MRSILILALISFFVQTGSAQCFDADASIWNNYWLSCEKTASPNADRGDSHWVQYDLGAIHKLSHSRFWNINKSGEFQNGFRDVAIDYSVDGITWETLGTFVLEQGNGDAIYGGTKGPDFGGVEAQYVLVTGLSNWGGGPCAGFTEMMIYLIQGSVTPSGPEPPGPGVCEVPEEAHFVHLNSEEVVLFIEENEEAEAVEIRYRVEGSNNWIVIDMDGEEGFLEGLDPETYYEVEVRVLCDGEWTDWEPLDGFETIEEMYECGAPIHAQVFYPEEDVAEIVWNEVPDSEEYQVRYRIKGNPWIKVIVDEPFFTLENYVLNVVYQFQVRSRCEDEWSGWSQRYSFRTGEIDDVAKDEAEGLGPDLDFAVFPNPAFREAQISFISEDNMELEITLIDGMGRQTYSKEVAAVEGLNMYKIETAKRLPGVYVVRMTNSESGATAYKKLVIVEK